jgi:hypothetical protein
MSEHGRGASTYENARQIKSEQMRIPIKSAWQGGALPLSYTRRFLRGKQQCPAARAAQLLIAAAALK